MKGKNIFDSNLHLIRTYTYKLRKYTNRKSTFVFPVNLGPKIKLSNFQTASFFLRYYRTMSTDNIRMH